MGVDGSGAGGQRGDFGDGQARGAELFGALADTDRGWLTEAGLDVVIA